jgi:hypothetical protein
MAKFSERAQAKEAERVALKGHLRAVLKLYDRNTCTHDETHRGGAIWTICDGCGKQWADDRGGFVPYVDPPEIAAARVAVR